MPQLYKQRGASVLFYPQLWQLLIWTKEQNMMLAPVLGSGPPGGPLLWPLLGPALSFRARPTSALDMDHEEMVQECSRAALFFCSQSSINGTAEKLYVPQAVHLPIS